MTGTAGAAAMFGTLLSPRISADRLTRLSRGRAARAAPLLDLGVVAAHTQGPDVEVGVWVVPERWSTGVGGEALRAVLSQLGRCFPQHRVVVAEADVADPGSDRLPRSVGFRRGAQTVGRYGNMVYRYCWDISGSKPDRAELGA